MRKILFIPKSNNCKELFQRVEKPPYSEKIIADSFIDVVEENPNSWFSLIVLESPTDAELDAVQRIFKTANILAVSAYNEPLKLQSSLIDELYFFEADNVFERVLSKQLFKIIELRELRRKLKLNEILFENSQLPTLISRKIGNSKFAIEGFNKAFQENSIINKRIAVGTEIDLFKLYNVTDPPSFENNKRQVKFTAKKKVQNSETDVQIIIIEHKLRDSDLVYQIAFEAHSVIDHSIINHLNERLEYMEGAKNAQSEYLASIAHDIRKPLNNIIGLVDILKESGLGQDQSFIAQSLTESSNSLKNLINDLLDSSKLDSGNFEINNEYFEIRPFIDSIRTMFLKESNDKKIDFKVSIDDEIPVWLEGDKNRLSQIIINLVSNALKFTEKGKVKLEMHLNKLIEDKALVQFKVIDSGIGIEPEVLDKIFESYSQANGQIKLKYGGTGLGLTICKKLSKLMGGSIWVESELGQGSTFYVEIPFGNAAVVNSAESEKKEKLLEGINILVVDDNEVAAFVLSNLFSQKGAMVKVAYSGKSAIGKFSKNEYDIVITDIQLPDISGLRLSNQLKTQAAKKGKNLPVFGISAFPYPRRIQNEGLLDFFALKPINPSELIGEINSHVELAKNTKSKEMNYRIIDIEHIKTFTGGDPVFIRQLVDIFLKRTPEYMDELKEAVKAKEWEKIKTMAHKVKPTFTYVGMGTFTDKVGIIEDYAIKKDITTIENILDEVWDDCQLAFDEFDNFVQNMEDETD